MPLNERYAPRTSARSRFVGPAGEAVEHRALGNARVVEHAERVVPRVAGVDHEREVELVAPVRSARGTRPPGRRPASACSRSRSRPRRWPRRRRSRASATSSSHSVGEAARRRGGAARRSPRRRGAPRRARPTRRDDARSVPTHTTAPTPAARARSSAASAPPVSHGRWQWLSSPGHVSMRGNSGAPFSSVEPAGRQPHAAASGSRSSAGAAGKAESSPQLRRRARDQRRRQQRDDAQRLEAVAEHRGDRGGVTRFVERPGLLVLDVRVRVADEVPDRAEAVRVVERPPCRR